MSKIYQDNSLTIGNTPLVRLNRIGNGNILVKIESRNPSFSVKCRIGANMIWHAEKNNNINKNVKLIEATSGNTGIALAYVAASRNYRLTLTMPETMSIERKKILKSLGAELILTDGRYGMKGAISKANDIISRNPSKYFLLKQFENPANPEIHQITTGPEIWNDTNGNLDILISAVGTGGTITGITRYIKKIKRKKNLISIAVEPSESPVITQFLAGKAIEPGPHKIQGIGPGFIPKNLDLTIIDQVITVSSEEAILTAKELMKKEGILAGISSGAALYAAIKIQQQKKFSDKKIVVILPSSGERYLSTELFSEL
ncbi:cysteine synthase A [Buchnera aphidicola str. APS (Acyrthosiphon pisum)]|uniref:Cysteine synthase n=1 Tax=Buchnera aphidicola subsp. Acyrthosiphon pisum (strain APS) TaxID=107806 RepID=CYSK_BUCAI|nr:cysteine synthase A [Buchnera aphidicola]P57171.1 RecName: Full=Cysteine synthase; Short=CSase; AltName: Full=O-acetylserine (thiol)-lyase; Short=OAS-TL; AltName: Full=O-acetylserine sulfhydrylase [Buchnera aphidicola str. APS (Acyrthosiphon pisum)]pir/E84937/ cysteine synthase (EC 4.2.99.8) A [imported] - Buchnera sp. (strain APS) [Buchnera sp. (in: enterobacteria)]ADP67620.1 cysteine synthase A [Buchnera aphidicola str. JF98 (Acyrthosiphon pisum)]ACL29893.1 cysteine synthase A [Buchnera ap